MTGVVVGACRSKNALWSRFGFMSGITSTESIIKHDGDQKCQTTHETLKMSKDQKKLLNLIC